jgi:hypothetical protein
LAELGWRPLPEGKEVVDEDLHVGKSGAQGRSLGQGTGRANRLGESFQGVGQGKVCKMPRIVDEIGGGFSRHTELQRQLDKVHGQSKMESNEGLWVGAVRRNHEGQLGEILQVEPNAHVGV